jgi:hypothetical protein
MMYGINARTEQRNKTAVNERMRINTRVRLPGGDVDVQTAMPITRRPLEQRSLRSARHQPKENRCAREEEKEKRAVNLTGISLRALVMTTSLLAIVLGMILLLDLSAMMEKGKEVNAITASVEKTTKQIEQLQVDLAMATRETDVAYNASQRLGLIAGKGAQTVYVQVPAKYQQSGFLQAATDAPPVQNGAYAALSGFVE